MTGPTPPKNLDKDIVEEWLRKASLNELNIFYDRNKIIVWLCRALLKAWKVEVEEESPPPST
jgi:hypothetical protein